MKNLLLFNYNINIDEKNIQKYGDNYSFYIDYFKFYLIKLTRPKTDVEKIFNLLSSIINSFHQIIKTTEQKYTVSHNNFEYCLVKIIIPENTELDLRDIVNSQIKIPFTKENELFRINWGKLWEDKIDYLEYQVSELASKKPIIRSSFNYYVGLAENAISYFNRLNLKDIPVYISHKRIKYPNISLNFYNPLEIVIDYLPRDIASYLKECFFENGNYLEELKILLNKNKLSNIEYHLLFVRLLYPSYYFDKLSLILEEKKREEILLSYIEKTKEYEKFLKEVYTLINKKTNLLKIEWLVQS